MLNTLMPYGRSRRYRYNRRTKPNRILLNRSAKSQSKQIYALNRRVNYLSKANKPELRTLIRNYDKTFTNASLSSNFGAYAINPWVASYLADDQAAGTKQVEGNFARSKGLALHLLFQYSAIESLQLSEY